MCYPARLIPTKEVGYGAVPARNRRWTSAVTGLEVANTAAPGLLSLRDAPAGLPDPNVQPPAIAEVGDPFAAVRVLHLLARVERGRPVRVDDLVDLLNSMYVDWLFERPVVVAVALQLQANWMADYRNTTGIVLEEGSYGLSLTIEDSSRVDPWIVRQVARAAAACQDRLRAFGRLDRVSSGG